MGSGFCVRSLVVHAQAPVSPARELARAALQGNKHLDSLIRHCMDRLHEIPRASWGLNRVNGWQDYGGCTLQNAETVLSPEQWDELGKVPALAEPPLFCGVWLLLSVAPACDLPI
jgi:hypothetical protein